MSFKLTDVQQYRPAQVSKACGQKNKNSKPWAQRNQWLLPNNTPNLACFICTHSQTFSPFQEVCSNIEKALSFACAFNFFAEE
jgi:hypothetical protein